MSAKHVVALEQAKKLIARGEEDFVCLAVSGASADRVISQRLRNFVSNAISPHRDVKYWLESSDIFLDDEQIRLYRLAWIDQMIPIVKEWP